MSLLTFACHTHYTTRNALLNDTLIIANSMLSLSVGLSSSLEIENGSSDALCGLLSWGGWHCGVGFSVGSSDAGEWFERETGEFHDCTHKLTVHVKFTRTCTIVDLY